MAESWRKDRRKTAERGYGGRWQRERLQFLARNPLCRMCKEGSPSRMVQATTVDHRIPHQGDMRLFWDHSNWQSLCTTHHVGDKQVLERTGKAPRRIGADGYPIETPGGSVETFSTPSS